MADLEFAFLADAAEARPGEKFYVLGGGVARLGAASLPFVHPHLTLVVGIRLGRGEAAAEHEVRFVLVSPSGQELAGANGMIQGQGQPDPGPTTITFAIDLWNLSFEQAGDHVFRISLDGVERKRLPLVVDRPAGPPAAPISPVPPGGPGVN